jgi:hypothetical protein
LFAGLLPRENIFAGVAVPTVTIPCTGASARRDGALPARRNEQLCLLQRAGRFGSSSQSGRAEAPRDRSAHDPCGSLLRQAKRYEVDDRAALARNRGENPSRRGRYFIRSQIPENPLVIATWVRNIRRALRSALRISKTLQRLVLGNEARSRCQPGGQATALNARHQYLLCTLDHACHASVSRTC